MSVNPYAGPLGGRDAVAVMRDTPARLAKVVAGLSAEAVEAAPTPGRWSPREVLAHLADCEIVFGMRLRQARAGQPMVQPFDQDAWARTYQPYTAEQALSTFHAVRAWNLTLIENLSDAEKTLPVTHPERGDMTLWTIVETMAGHDENHVGKLEAL